MTDEITLQTIMERMPKALIPEKAQGVDAVIQYHLSGEGGGDWVVTIRDGACQVEAGTAESPKLTLTAAADDYRDIVLGKLDAMGAFAQGKLRLKGDLNLAMKLPGMFRMR
jgi:putative sterol carrier protein